MFKLRKEYKKQNEFIILQTLDPLYDVSPYSIKKKLDFFKEISLDNHQESVSIAVLFFLIFTMLVFLTQSYTTVRHVLT